MKAYLGLDLGTYMGWARTDLFPGSGGVFLSGAWDFDITRFDAPPVRYQKFEVKLREHCVLALNMVFYEKILRHKGTTAAHVYGAFLNKLHEVCDEYGVPYIGLSVQEIKKFATGKGGGPQATKDKMIEA
ncbi:hypothetical protein KXW37_004268, partial [Aspergillus fumigatus]